MQIFTVDPIGWKSVAFLVGFIVAVPAIGFAVLAAAHARQYVIAWFVTGFVTLLAAALLAQVSVSRVTIDGRSLIVGGGLYRQTIDADAIRKSEIHPISLSDGSFDLGVRTNGIGMPGMALGWFQPVNGKKLFVLVTDHTPVLVPTTGLYDVVVSPVDTDRFIAAIKGM